MIRGRSDENRSAIQQRCAEIDRWLNVFGFRKKNSLNVGRSAVDGDDDAHVERLKDLLQVLGPVFSSFGLYLASRPDLLPLGDSAMLATIADRSSPTPGDQIRQLVRTDLSGEATRRATSARFVKFDPEPFESHLLYQRHYGELDGGDWVVVKIIHPRVRAAVELHLLSRISHLIAPRWMDHDSFDQTVAAFQRELCDALDCRATAEALQTLAHDTRDDPCLSAPKVYHELCSEQVLVTQRLKGRRLDQIGQRSHPSHLTCEPPVADHLARLLCDAWLGQLQQGTHLPIELRPHDVLLRSPTEIALVDGRFASLPSVARRNLMDYVIAVATDQPGKALTCLIKEVDRSGSSESIENLDRQFRQLVAFRDGSWDDDGRADGLAETLFAQWRLLKGSGYQPMSHLVHFYRGTFHLTLLARQLAPHRDALQEGVKDLRLSKLISDLGTMMEPSYWGGQLDRVASLMILGPQHLDDALRAMSNDQERSPSTRKAGAPARNGSHWMWIVVLLFGPILLAEPLAQLLTPVWADRVSGLIFLAAGGWLLRYVTLSRDG